MSVVAGKRQALLLMLLSAVLTDLQAQSLDLTIHRVGISIGDAQRVVGLRLNFRDRRLEHVDGLNATIWAPYRPVRGVVHGVALGVPMTGARRVAGAGIGLLGVSARERLTGLVLGGVGAAAGETLTGIGLGGVGIGAGEHVRGVLLGGIGIGAGSDAEGLLVGGLGVAAGNNGVGVLIGGLGAGVGKDATGLLVGGLGVAAGGTLRGVAVGGMAAGAPTVRGVLLSGVLAGALDMSGLAVAGAYFQIAPDGHFRGMAVSAFNHIRGTQRGLTIGLLNYARRLHGLQLGLLNYAGNQPPALRWLPFLNLHR